MKLKVINIDGEKIDDIELSDKIFSLSPNKKYDSIISRLAAESF